VENFFAVLEVKNYSNRLRFNGALISNKSSCFSEHIAAVAVVDMTRTTSYTRETNL